MKKELSKEVEQAAIFLMSLPSEDAAKLLSYLGPKEVHQLGLAMASLDHVDKKTVNKIYSDFIIESENQTSIGVEKDQQIRKVLITALGEEKANTVIDKILLGKESKGLDTLKWMDAKTIAEMIRYEHPQIQAIILSYLDAEQSAQVLSSFEEKVRLDLIMRICAQESIQPQAIEELNSVMESQVINTKINQSRSIGGVKRAADILNFVDVNVESSLLGNMEEKNKPLAKEIRELMFVFDDLKTIDDRGMQALLREIKTDTLVIALKAADQILKDKFFKNMSKRAADLLKDDLEIKGPMRIQEVEAAQKEILAFAKNLADEGKLVLGSKEGEMI